MGKQKKNKNISDFQESDLYGIDKTEDFFVSSSMDYTGLIPAGLVSEAQREAYEELYPSLTPPPLNGDGEAE
ncbi:MAG: hypothetical protein SO415_14990 [Oliverpabstia sp.]|nr:hypothetical protein [Oliverpabstia sp.]